MRDKAKERERKRLARLNETPEQRKVRLERYKEYARKRKESGYRRQYELARGQRKGCVDCGREKEPGQGRTRCSECIGFNLDEVTDPKIRRRVVLLRRYGLTLATYDDLLASQGGGCAICGATDKRLNVDHDHACCPANNSSCGKCVRGLLCGGCNVKLEFWIDHQPQIQEYLNCQPTTSVEKGGPAPGSTG